MLRIMQRQFFDLTYRRGLEIVEEELKTLKFVDGVRIVEALQAIYAN